MSLVSDTKARYVDTQTRYGRDDTQTTDKHCRADEFAIYIHFV